MTPPLPDFNVDRLDAEHRKLAFERLHFLNFLNDKSPLSPCNCPSGQPTPILAEGPPNAPSEKRRIECGKCHKFYFWLPKLKNKDRRPSSSTNLADGMTCQCCRKIGVNLIGHHIVEVAEGGSDEPDNIWTVCVPCHAIIHALRRHALEPASLVGEAQRQQGRGP
jgi:hypothetical protein